MLFSITGRLIDHGERLASFQVDHVYGSGIVTDSINRDKRETIVQGDRKLVRPLPGVKAARDLPVREADFGTAGTL